MRIAVDVDGTLADVIPLWTELYNSRSARKIKLDDINHWEFWKRIGISTSEFFSVFSEAWRNWRAIPATEDHVGSKIQRLRAVAPVDIVTGRTKDTERYVKMWLADKGIVYDSFILMPSWGSKASLPHDVFIDDSPGLALQASSQGRRVFLYDQPWNREIQENELIVRVRSIDEAVTSLEKGRPITPLGQTSLDSYHSPNIKHND